MLILVAAIAVAGGAALARRHVVIGLVTLTGLLPVIVNMVLLPRYGSNIAVLFALGSAALIVGGILPSVRTPGYEKRKGLGDVDWDTFATALALFVIAGTVVHFAIGGVPLMSSNVEIARFDITASGLFGVPGRIYLFGIPLALAACLRAERVSDKDAFSSWQTRLILITFAVSRILSGFKSGLVEVVVTTLIVYFASGHSINRKHLLQFLAAFGVALAFGFAVGATYNTYRERGLMAALVDRISFQTSDPAAVVLAHADFHDFGSNSIVVDAAYFTNRYFHIGDQQPFSFSQIVSSRVTGTPLSPDRYFVPVTTTAIAEQIYDFGIPLACVTLALTGYIMNSAERLARRVVKPHTFLMAVTIVLGAFEYVSKGGLVYAIYNWTTVCLLLIAIAAVANVVLLGSPRNQTSISRA